MVFGKHINRYYFKYAGWLILGLLSLVAVDYLQLEIPKLERMLINGMNGGSVEMGGVSLAFDMDFLLDKICMPMVGIIFAMVIGRFLWRICFFGAAVRLETDLRNRMFDHSKDLSPEYYQVNKVGNLMSLFTNDLDTVQECFGWGVLMFFDALLLGVLAVGNMWTMSRTLTLFTLVPMALLLASATVIGKQMMRKWDIRQQAFSRLSDFAQESFSGIAVIKAFVKEAKELLAFRRLNEENETANIDHTRSAVLLRILVTLFVESVICVILGYGGYLVYRGSFNAGQLVEFIGYFTAVIWPIMAVSELIDMTSRGKASLARIGELLDAGIAVKDRADAKPLEDVRGEIEFRGLSFRYPDGERDVLSDISATIRAGEHVGLVGKTGAGKTTLVDLLLRTYNIPDGTLFVDGVDVNTVKIRDLRAHCAYVPQDNFLFSDTIENNIAFGVEEHARGENARADGEHTGVENARVRNTGAEHTRAGRAGADNMGADHAGTDLAGTDLAGTEHTRVLHTRVENAAKLADVHDNIEQFGQGYETVLGERGVTVSGGQKQRISIARALMKDAPILILDDSVSAVDTKTEAVILENLRTARQGKTTILIAHRVTTIEKMDKILFLEDGRLTASGTHEELYAACPEYRKMVDLQKLEEEGSERDA